MTDDELKAMLADADADFDDKYAADMHGLCHTLAAHVCTLVAEVRRLNRLVVNMEEWAVHDIGERHDTEARVAELEAALKPFAELGEKPRWMSTSKPVAIGNNPADWDAPSKTQPVSLDDCRRAAAVLKGEVPK